MPRRSSMACRPMPGATLATSSAARSGCGATTRGPRRPNSSSPSRRIIRQPSTPTNGGSSGGSSPASCSTRGTRRRPIGSRARRFLRAGRTTASSISSRQVGSHCASSTIRRRRRRISRRSRTASPLRSRSLPPGVGRGGPLQGLDARSERRAHYQAAAPYPTAYYGQIARARLGLKDLPLRPAPERPDAAQLEIVRAIELLYGIGERDLVAGVLADLGDRAQDAGALTALGNIAVDNKDARATLLLGKAALARGLPL